MSTYPSNIHSLPAGAAGRIVKAVFIGSYRCGKTTLLCTFANRRFPLIYQPTIFDGYSNVVAINNERYNVGLWDTAGSDEYDRLRPLSYPQTDVFVLMYAVDDPHSFAQIKTKWLPEIRANFPTKPFPPIVLVATRIDVRAAQQYNRAGGAKWAPNRDVHAHYAPEFRATVRLLLRIQRFGHTKTGASGGGSDAKTSGVCHLSRLPKDVLYRVIEFLAAREMNEAEFLVFRSAKYDSAAASSDTKSAGDVLPLDERTVASNPVYSMLAATKSEERLLRESARHGHERFVRRPFVRMIGSDFTPTSYELESAENMRNETIRRGVEAKKEMERRRQGGTDPKPMSEMSRTDPDILESIATLYEYNMNATMDESRRYAGHPLRLIYNVADGQPFDRYHSLLYERSMTKKGIECVSTERGEALAAEIGATLFREVSSITTSGVDELIHDAVLAAVKAELIAYPPLSGSSECCAIA